MNTQTIIQYWNDLATREQVLLLACALTALVVGVFSLAWEPLAQERAQLRSSNQAAMVQLNWMRQSVSNLRALRTQEKQGANSPVRKEGNINRLLQTSAKTMGLSLDRFQPGKDKSMRIWVKNADFNTLWKWLHQAEHQHKLNIAQTNIVSTKKPGKVNAQIHLNY